MKALTYYAQSTMLEMKMNTLIPCEIFYLQVANLSVEQCASIPQIFSTKHALIKDCIAKAKWSETL